MLTHGGDIAGHKAKYGRQPLDFSANVSPLGVPEGVKSAVTAALETADRYPDPLCRELTAAIANMHGVSPGHVLCGNGAADIIFRLALALRPESALLPAPTFAEYEQALGLVDCQIKYHLLRREDDFALTDAVLNEITPGLGVLFLCQPNNPTGQPCTPALLHRIADACAKSGTLLVADECFADFLQDPQYSLLGRLDEGHIIILKAFTKQYAMAGVRLGYCLCANGPLLERMRACGQPWEVSSLAQAAGVAALKESDYLKRLFTLIDVERLWLIAGLEALGCHCTGSRANFIFFESAEGLCERLAERDILIRGCANYRGLSECYYRVAVRTHTENERLVAAMGEVLR